MAQKRFLATNGFDANSKTITNVVDPVNAQDAATKAFSSNASNLSSGTVPAAQLPALSGDISTTQGSTVTSLSTTGIIAGTYKSVTIDSKGRATEGTNPTTLAGFGITDAYTKTETDTLIQGLDPKGSVKAATTVNIALSGPQTIDTVSVVPGDRVLVKNQTAAAENGIYIVQAGSWTRSADMDVWSEVPNAYIFVEQGSQADNGYLCTSEQGGTLGTTAITFVQFTGAGQITAGTGLSKSGNTLSISNTTVTAGSYGSASNGTTLTVNAQGQITSAVSTPIAITSSAVSGLAASATTDTTNASNISSGTLAAARLPAFTGDVTSTAGSNALTLANVATAGNYKSVTINSKGLVISGTNPTTIDGYGITDALRNNAANTSLLLTNGSVGSATLTTAATTANQVLSTEAIATVRAAKYIVQITSGSSYHMVTIDVLHNGTNAYISSYNEMWTGVSLASFDADINAGSLRLLTSPVNAITTYKVVKTLINI
jgi:phage-related tail fiber protein